MPHNKCEWCFYKDQPDRGCPCWITAENGFVEANIQTGEERILTGCYYEVFFQVLSHVVRASNRPAAAFDKLATVVCKGFQATLSNDILMKEKFEDLTRKQISGKREADRN